MRWKSTLVPIGLLCLALSIVAVSTWLARRDRLRDAWALFSRYEPACGQVSEPNGESNGARDREGPASSASALAARRALAREALAIVEELTNRGRSSKHRLLAAGVEASRKACDLLEEPGVALSSRLDLADLEAHRRRAAALGDLRFSRSRLGRLLPMSDDELSRRVDRYGERLSAAVSREMEKTVVGPESPRLAATEPLDRPRGSTSDDTSGYTDPQAESEPSGESDEPRIVIHSTSGESWEEVRDRRARERVRRFSAWRPLADRELAPVMRLRRVLGKHLETDSLAGGVDICARLGDAARAADQAVVRDAPDRRLSSAIGRTLDGYAAAGRACSESRYAMAFVELTDADASWMGVVGAPGSPGRAAPTTSASTRRPRASPGR